TVASTHDLPTLKGFWEGRDLEIRDELELWPETKIREEFFQARTEQRQGLLDALCAEGVWNGEKSAEKLGTLPQELADAMLVYIARGKNELMAVQLEDVMGQREQVNLPGTVSEHPNWNRKLPKSFESLRDDESRRAIFNRITEERRKGR
ncbi:MAG: 4-alpha-glucanotransferase, partial [Myxococcota bacterium]